MSLEATKWAWRQQVKGTHKLVLLSLADRADDRNACYPSVERLVDDTCLNRKTIMEAVVALEQSGLIEVIRVFGAGNKYRLLVAGEQVQTSTGNGTTTTICTDGETSTEINTGTETGTSTKNGTQPVPKTVLGPVPKTVLKSTNESTNEPLNLLFNRFWVNYPRKQGKDKALKAFAKIKPDNQLVDRMIANVSGRLSRGEWRDVQYIPMPATYLNGKRWEDEPVPVASVHPLPKPAGIARSFADTDYRDGATADGTF